MNPIAVFYHCRLSGGATNIQPAHAFDIVNSQMVEMEQCGLVQAASEMYVGVNGSDADFTVARCITPEKANVLQFPDGESELTTMRFLREWLTGKEGWYVCYFHSKCATRPDPGCAVWRERMQYHVITNWRQCVSDLDAGYDAVGSHWLTPERYPGLVGHPYFAGTFWWSKASFLMTLPSFPKPTWENRYEAESWIGKGPDRPRVKEYAKGWPM